MNKKIKKAGRTLCVCLALILFTTSLTACDFSGAKEPDDNYRVYYEIFVRSFADGNGDGIGDFIGATQKISYIKDLGATGIWLMPVMPSDTYHKYDVDDYMAIDPEYGTIDDFKTFVDTCHKNGLKVIIDMDINHTSVKNPWFTKACDYLKTLSGDYTIEEIKSGADAGNDSLYVKYYNFADEQINSSYYPLEGTNYFYEGMFWDGMPDLDLSCPELRSELNGICDFWINLGVDGFRMDAAGHYNESDDEFNKSVLNEIYEYCKSQNPDFYMVSEVWESEAVIAKYYESMTPSMFNFDLAGPEGKILRTAKGTFTAEKLAKVMVSYENDFSKANPDYIDAPFVANHDMGRVANALSSDEAAMKFAGGLNLIMKGSPFIYYGEEIGMKSKGTKDENKRLGMQWGDGEAEREYMCENPPGADEGIEQSFGSVQSQKDNPDSIYAYYKNAISIRRRNPAVARGKTDIIARYEKGNVVVLKRTYGDDFSLIAINTGEDSEVPFSDIDGPGYGVDLDKLKIDGAMLVDNSAEVKYKDRMLTIPAKAIVVMK